MLTTFDVGALLEEAMPEVPNDGLIMNKGNSHMFDVMQVFLCNMPWDYLGLATWHW